MPASPLPLKDIHLPEAVSWFPPALGWWLLVLCLPLVTAFLYWLYKRLTRQTALKSAKKILATIQQDRLGDNHKKLSELSVLLRRVAISLNPRAEVASLTGAAWLAFLDSSLKDAPFSQGIGQCLSYAPYQKTPLTETQMNALIALCANWLNAQKH